LSRIGEQQRGADVLTQQNIEAELSYAYLHAVATRAGFDCSYSSRNLDAAGVDATITEDNRFLAEDSAISFVQLHVQLKATIGEPANIEGNLSYRLTLPHSNKLRKTEIAVPRILAVLFLPKDPMDWLIHSEDGLLACRCAYWVSLYGALESTNESYQTVYLPRAQVLSADGLTTLMTRISRGEVIPYEA
jgi:hypothetical protein